MAEDPVIQSWGQKLLTKVLQQGFDFSVNPVSGHVLSVSG